MNGNSTMIVTEYLSPCGTLELGAIGNKLCMCDWIDNPSHESNRTNIAAIKQCVIERGVAEVIETAATQLDEYFARSRQSFDIPLAMIGSDFRKLVWHQLCTIPYGTTDSYGSLARSMQLPHHTRAIANAAGANAISIIIPCHRLIGSDGKLTGYAGGLAAKRYLIDLERSL